MSDEEKDLGDKAKDAANEFAEEAKEAAKDFAKLDPTNSAPSSPGPLVYATASRSSSDILASSSTDFTTGTIFL